MLLAVGFLCMIAPGDRAYFCAGHKKHPAGDSKDLETDATIACMLIQVARYH
jgi:hypothetical protein